MRLVITSALRLWLCEVAFGSLTHDAYAQGLFAISEPRLGSYVAARPSFEINTELNVPVLRSKLQRREVWLLMTIIGNAQTLKYLQENESLQLEAVIFADDVRWSSVQIGMSYDDWERDGQALTDQLRDQSIFTWRTRLKTTRIDASKLEIKFFDQFGNCLSPINYPGSYSANITFK